MAGVRFRSTCGALAAALLLAAALPLLASPALAADGKAWDQAAVAKLGADLAKACIALYNEYYDEQGINAKIGTRITIRNGTPSCMTSLKIRGSFMA